MTGLIIGLGLMGVGIITLIIWLAWWTNSMEELREEWHESMEEVQEHWNEGMKELREHWAKDMKEVREHWDEGKGSTRSD